MENVTLGQVQNVLVFLIALVGAIFTIIGAFRKAVEKTLEPVNKSLATLTKKIDSLQADSEKNGDMIYQMLDHLATDNNTGEMKRALDQYNQYYRHAQ